MRIPFTSKGINVGWAEQREAQQRHPVGLHAIQPNLLGCIPSPERGNEKTHAEPQKRWFPRSPVGIRTRAEQHDSAAPKVGWAECNEAQQAGLFCIPTPERGNAASGTLAAGLMLLLATACQPAFIGIDSEADVAAENCYAYRYGDKLRQINFAQAFDWCHRSARYGNAHSQALLGELYYLGLGGEPDIANAARWFETAAKQGHAHAQYMLYRIHVGSPNLEQQELAAYWLQQARASGYKLALQEP